MVTDPQTQPQTHTQTDRTDYNTLRRSFTSTQCNNNKIIVTVVVTVQYTEYQPPQTRGGTGSMEGDHASVTTASCCEEAYVLFVVN